GGPRAGGCPLRAPAPVFLFLVRPVLPAPPPPRPLPRVACLPKTRRYYLNRARPMLAHDGNDAPPTHPCALGKVQMCQCLGFKPLALCRRDVETQIDRHLDLVTAILAKPDMTDFVVAHVCRPLWCDQKV